MREVIDLAKNKIRLHLWSIDFAKGYCSAMLNNVYDKKLTEAEYDEFANMIDELN